ncbi:TonB-dependent receptor [Parapedobacter sp. 2B3]|uniref:TonB-dependent receptor n=1 Tax=Parapedobacter sp. 2B3 TaxID=3342381 RepID=UPI0035B63CA7
MKLTVFFIVLLTLQTAAEAFSQEVTLRMRGGKLEKALREIRKQTGYAFVLNDVHLREAKPVTVDVRNQPISRALEILFSNQPFAYELGRDAIVIRPKATAGPRLASELAAPMRVDTDVRGRVVDSLGNPLQGATVRVKNHAMSTVTNEQGEFSLHNVPEGSQLEIVFMGFRAREVAAAPDMGNIVLAEVPSILDEVVVVGYGVQRKSDVIGSVSTLDVGKATSVPTSNVNEMIRGQAAGVQVNLADPRPGGRSNITIRGVKSFQGGNEPLYVLDGFPIDNINDVNPDDIASVEILKDASAQAIYGARASNGVILITTKRGKTGRMTIGYHGYSTTQQLTRNFDLYSPEEFAQLRREAWRTSNPPDYTYPSDIEMFDDFELEALQNQNFVNWEEMILRKAVVNSHTLSVSGGSERTQLYSSLTYFDQRGLIKGSGYERLAFRTNINQTVNDRVSLEANINFITDKQDIESTSLNFITISPLAKPFDEDGNLVRFPLGPNSLTVNPLWNIRESTNESRDNLLNINFAFNYKITDNLTYRFNGLLNRSNTNRGLYLTSQHSQGVSARGRAEINDLIRNEYLVENILTWDKTFGSIHQIDITGVQSINEINHAASQTIGTTFPNDLLGYHGIGDALNKDARRTETRRAISSFMGRVRYNLMDKYLFSVTGRYDGSSVFAKGNKWGFFPAVAAAWKVNNESFLRDVSSIDELKWRVSYGEVGNQAIAPFQTLGTVGSFPYIFGGNTVGGNIPGTDLPNPNLTWETSTMFNTGIDFSLWRGRLSGVVEYYNTRTTDLLVNISLAGTTGFASTVTNGAESQNRGVEVTLNGQLIKNADFSWGMTTMFSRNRNKILKTGLYDIHGNPADDRANNRFVGYPINVVFQRKFDGIFQTQAEIDASAQQTQPDIMPGHIRVVDVNGDGVITDDDNVVFARDPKWFGSVANTFRYKGFDLYADIYMSQGAINLNPYLAQFETGGSMQGVLNGIKVPYWTPENPSTEYPRPSRVTQSNLFALAVQDASYIRLRALTLGYTLPSAWTERLKISSIRVYAMFNNLVTITDYKSYSPELNPDSFPDAKSYSAGVRVDF